MKTFYDGLFSSFRNLKLFPLFYFKILQGNRSRKFASEAGGWRTVTNLSIKVDPTDRNINIQCHAVNQEVADTRVESHAVAVLCKYSASLTFSFSSISAKTERKIFVY